LYKGGKPLVKSEFQNLPGCLKRGMRGEVKMPIKKIRQEGRINKKRGDATGVDLLKNKKELAEMSRARRLGENRDFNLILKKKKKKVPHLKKGASLSTKVREKTALLWRYD